MDCCTGQALALLVVKVPAATHGLSETMSDTSNFFFFFLMPACMPLARNPSGVVTVPRLLFSQKGFTMISILHLLQIPRAHSYFVPLVRPHLSPDCQSQSP